MTPKDAIRREMRERRRALTPDERARASASVCAKLAVLGMRSPVAVYLASSQEIDLAPFVLRMLEFGVRVVAPRWNGAVYELATVRGLDEGSLRKGPMGILEPAEEDVVPPAEVLDWLVPGLAFTRDGRRLGYGGGWYDRLLASASEDARKIGIAHAFQIVSDLPCEPHDIRLTELVDDLHSAVGSDSGVSSSFARTSASK